jgi:hypothetical protein
MVRAPIRQVLRAADQGIDGARACPVVRPQHNPAALIFAANGARVRLWKMELQRLADETGLAITVAHLPPGTSKWNRIEHRLFAFITQNRRGKPLLTYEVVVQLISATKTRKGLTVQCSLDRTANEKGIKVSDAEMATLNITPADFRREWNYTFTPRTPDD